MIATVGFWKAEKTKYIPFFTVFAAMLNVVLNYAWVPQFRGIGAALATAVAFFIWNVSVLIVSEKLWYVGFPLKIMSVQILVGICGVIWIDYAYKESYSLVYVALISHAIVIVLVLTSVELSLKKIKVLFGKAYKA